MPHTDGTPQPTNDLHDHALTTDECGLPATAPYEGLSCLVTLHITGSEAATASRLGAAQGGAPRSRVGQQTKKCRWP
jgi:hypothetical protein